MENVLFGGRNRAGASEADYLHELERINNELRGFVPIGATEGAALSRVSTDATDSGVEASVATQPNISNGETQGSGERFPSGDFY